MTRNERPEGRPHLVHPNGTTRPAAIPAPREPYGGPSQGYAPCGQVYIDRLDAKAERGRVDDPEALFARIVDQIGEDRARTLLFRRGSAR